MTSPPDGSTTTSRRDAAIELAVILAASLALRLVLRSETVKDTLPEMPVIKHAWVFFLFTMALFLWLARRHGGNVAEFGIKPFRPWRRMLALGVLGFVAAVVLDVTTNPLVQAVFGKPQLQQFAAIQGNLPVYLMLIAAAFVFGGVGEELLYRGMIMIGILAIVDGLIFLKADSNLWPVVIAHGLLDTFGFTLLYAGLMKTG